MGQNIGVSVVNSGGQSAAYNINAVGNIKKVAGVGVPGRLRSIVVQVAPSAGALTLNDCLHGAAAVGNQIATIPFGSLTVGQRIVLDWPCVTAIEFSAVGTGGVYSATYD